jgi:hypothetical protein
MVARLLELLSASIRRALACVLGCVRCSDRKRIPPPQVPDRVAPEALPPLLAPRLAGAPADGSQPAPRAAAKSVVWVDAGDELVVHLSSLRAATKDGILLVSVDVESDQTGRQSVAMPFAVGTDPGQGTVVVCEPLPRGPDVIVRRWGAILQGALFAALQDMAQVHAGERGGRPNALFVRDGALEFRTAVSG